MKILEAAVTVHSGKNRNMYVGMAEIIADRDRWKAKAEALERALKESWLQEECMSLCFTCVHHDPFGEQPEPCRNCVIGNDNWQFDEARFTGKAAEG